MGASARRVRVGAPLPLEPGRELTQWVGAPLFPLQASAAPVP